MSNYRPISILPVISKIAEKWVVRLLTAHLENVQPSLHRLQFGFRTHHSTDSALCVLTENIKGLLDKSPYVGAVFLDLKKAFDSVNHQILISRLTQFNISDQALLWFKSYLSDRKQYVVVDGVKSPCLDSGVGVPQGSILGPVLFSLFINNLPNSCPNVFSQMYADDVVIYTQAKTIQQAAVDLTAALSHVQNWLKDSCLMLNTRKTVCMYFSKRHVEITRSSVFLNGMELELVSEFKYLGVVLDRTFCFKSHVKKVAQVVKFNLQNFRHIRNNLTVGAAKIYFFAMIISHFDYCLTTWSLACPATLQTIESLYKKALKIFDKKSVSHHYCHVLKKHRLLGFHNMINLKMACQIYKVLHSLAPSPLKDFIKTKDSSQRTTRASTRGDLIIPHRYTTFGQTVLSVRGGNMWNSLPLTLRECPTYSLFKVQLKKWLWANQSCTH